MFVIVPTKSYLAYRSNHTARLLVDMAALFSTYAREYVDTEPMSVFDYLVDANRSTAAFDFTNQTGAEVANLGHLGLCVAVLFSTGPEDLADFRHGAAVSNRGLIEARVRLPASAGTA